MAPCSRLEEKLRKLGLSTDDTGCSRSSPASKAKYQFRMFFPMPPYDGLQFNALRSGTGFNFTGQLLGIGGKQLQRIKQESAARLQVNNAEGNLNGSHPDPLDPNLHALITADSVSKLQKAAMMVWELLAPVNGKFLPIDVVPGGSVRLTVQQPGNASAAAATKTATQQKKGAKASKGAPRCTSSSSSGNISSTLDPSFDSRPVSVSPLMTPVTPAAAAGQRPNRSGIEVTPSSCSSYSETTTPGSELSSSGRSNSSNGSNMRCLFNSLDDFSLPPAAIPAAANGADTYADPNTPQAQQQQQQQQQRQVMTTESLHSSDTQDDTLLEPATPCSGAAAAGTYTSEPARTKLSSQQQQQQQQEVWPLPGESRISSGSMQTPSVHDPHSAGQQAPADSSSDDSGGAAGAALPAGTPVPAAPSETVFSGAAGAAAAEACLLPPGAALQKPNWQQQQPPEIPVLGLDSSADGSSSSCFQYGLGLSSTSLDSSSSFCVKESPALQALIVDHQRQQQQQMAEQQQMQLMHMAHLQQQAQVGSFGSSVSAFGSSASLFGGPSPLLGPRTGSFAGSFESESLQLGPNALMHIAGSAQAQLGLQGQQLGMRPAGYTSLGLGAAPLGGAASGSFACSMGVPESPRFAGSQMHNGPQLQEQQRTMSALHHVAAGDSLCSSFDGSAGLSSNSMGRYTAGLHTGSVLGGLHLPGSVASCWAAGPNELPSSPMLFGTPPLSAAAVGNANGNGSGAGGDAAHSSSASAAANGAGLAMRGSLGRDVLPPAWLQPQHEAEQQQQHDMLMMVHAGQQLHAVQHEQRIALPSGAYSGQGASLAQPSTVSIW